MMDYTEFKEKIRTVLKEKLGENAAVLISMVEKPNVGEMETINIFEKGEEADGATPNFYIKSLYSEYKSGYSVEKIADKVLHLYRKSMRDFANAERKNALELLGNYESSRKSVYFRLINTEKNRRILDRRIHRHFLDLSMILYVLVKNDSEGIGSVAVTRDMLKVWKVTEQEVFEQAVRNTPLLFPVKVCRMSDMLNRLLGIEEDTGDIEDMNFECDFPVLSNERGINGFSVVLYQDVLKRLAEKLGTDFYILPSSLHEALLIPDNTGMDADGLREMVREVNATEVSEEDFLSDSIYHYSRTDGKLKIMTAEVTVHV